VVFRGCVYQDAQDTQSADYSRKDVDFLPGGDHSRIVIESTFRRADRQRNAVLLSSLTGLNGLMSHVSRGFYSPGRMVLSLREFGRPDGVRLRELPLTKFQDEPRY